MEKLPTVPVISNPLAPTFSPASTRRTADSESTAIMNSTGCLHLFATAGAQPQQPLWDWRVRFSTSFGMSIAHFLRMRYDMSHVLILFTT